MDGLRKAMGDKPILFDTVDLQFLREARRAELEQSSTRAARADRVKDRELAISVEEAGRRLGIGRSLAYEMANDGRLPAIRLGRRLMISVPRLELMLRDEAGQRPDKSE